MHYASLPLWNVHQRFASKGSIVILSASKYFSFLDEVKVSWTSKITQLNSSPYFMCAQKMKIKAIKILTSSCMWDQTIH